MDSALSIESLMMELLERKLGEEIRRSPVEVGSVSYYLEEFLHHPRCRKSEPSNILQVKVWNHYLIETSIYV